jgi:hypothetical protein
MRGPKRGTCTYCGSFEDMHEDDVPPKNIFQHRQNLIKVPSCYACNNPASKDDEYFMLYLALREDAKQKKEHAWLWAKAQRALWDEKARGLNRRLLSKHRWVPQTTPAGIILRPALGIPIEGVRTINVVIRIVKGLYFHEQGRRLPETHRVVAYDELAYRNPTLKQAQNLQWIRQNVSHLQSRPRKTVGSVFTYLWVSHPSDPATTMWLLDFFDGIQFFCASEPNGSHLLQ